MSSKKIKINYINNLFWLAPSISSYFRGRSYGYAPFKSLEDLVKAKNLTNENVYFSFNGLLEKNFDFFNSLNRIKKLEFRLNKENLYKIEHNQFVDDTSISEHLIIRWDQKAVNWVKKGFIPFYSLDWYLINFVKGNSENPENKKTIIKWNKNDFDLVE